MNKVQKVLLIGVGGPLVLWVFWLLIAMALPYGIFHALWILIGIMGCALLTILGFTYSWTTVLKDECSLLKERIKKWIETD